MSNTVKVMGFDPSFRNWGYCLADYNPETKQLSFTSGAVIKTKSEKLDRKNLSDLSNCYQLYSQLQTVLNEYNPEYVIAELPVGSQSSRAMVSYASCIALSAALTYRQGYNNIPLLTTTPQAIKRTVGKADATKKEVIQWVSTHYPETQTWLDDLPLNQKEHICDAIVATHTVLKEKPL